MLTQAFTKRIAREMNREWLVLALVTAAAAFLRLVALDRLPPGLYHDEAYNGLDALQVLRGHTPIFFEANNGREPLFIYLAAGSVLLFGRSPGALRLVSALAGTLTVPAVYWLGRELYGQRIGLLAAILATTTVWTLSLSRVAFRAVTMPPLQAVTLVLLWRGQSQRRLSCLVWAGIAYGLTFYTYLAARFSPLALLLFIFYILLWHREAFWLRGWAVFGALALVAGAPLGIYLVTHWSSTLERAGQVSIWNASINGNDFWGTLLSHIWRTALGFVYRGDFIPRHNVALRPFFDPLIALAFLAGVYLAARRARRFPAYGLSLIWLGVMLLPTILAEGAPHMLRATGILPVLFFFPALGLAELWRALARGRPGKAGPMLVGGVTLISAILSLNAYLRHVHSEALYYNMEAGATAMAVEINRFIGAGWRGSGLAAGPGAPVTGERQVYLAERLWRDGASVRYLCDTSEALAVLPAPGKQLPDRAGPAQVLLVLWPFEDDQAALALLPSHTMISVHEGARERGDLERESRLLYVAFQSQPPEGVPPKEGAAWDGGIDLAGYRLRAINDRTLEVDLCWRAAKPLDVSYTVFCHAACEGESIGQHDGLPANGYYATDRWRAGDIVEDRHVVSLSAPWDSRTCQVVVGLYRWETMQRLRLLDQSGQVTEETGFALR